MVLVLEAVTDSWLTDASCVIGETFTELTVKLWNMMEVWIGWVTDFITYLNHAPCSAATAQPICHTSLGESDLISLCTLALDPWKLKSWPLFLSSLLLCCIPLPRGSKHITSCNGPIDECRVNINKLERAIHTFI